MAKALPLLPLLLVVVAACAAATPAAAAAAPRPSSSPSYRRLFAFGDSLTDTGNFIRYSSAPGPVAHSPYGETFFHRPTGRWSDGRLIVDFIVERLGLPHWPPYLDAASKEEDFRHGANFAVASGTALSRRFFERKHLNVDQITPYSLAVQVRWFKQVLAMLLASASTDDGDGDADLEHREMMSSSLFMVGIGANDYIHPLFQNKTLDWVKPLVPLVIASIGSALETLIQLGAKTLHVPGIFPLGCAPRLLFLFRNGGGGGNSAGGDDYYDPATGCIRWLNDDLIVLHNSLLQEKLAQLRRDHPSVSLVYVDYYSEFLSVIASPARYGFDERTVLDACCAGGGFHNANFTVHCSEPGAVQCPDPSLYVSWDGLHMTEAMYRVMARDTFDPLVMVETVDTANNLSLPTAQAVAELGVCPCIPRHTQDLEEQNNIY